MKKLIKGLIVGVMAAGLVCQPLSASVNAVQENSVAASKAVYGANQRYLSVIANNVVITRDIPYCAPKENALLSDNNLLDIYQPAGDTGINRMAIVLLHGGGFTEGHKNEYTRISTDLAKRGFVVFSINYRLKAKPEEDFVKTLSDGANDIKDAVAWIKTNSAKYGVDKDHIAIGGGSAGSSVALEAAYGKSTGIPGCGAFAVLDLYGTVDMIVQSGEFNKSSLPAIIVHGVQDPVIPIAGDEAFIKKLSDAGIYHEFVPLEKSGHGIIEEYMDDAVLNISRFLYRVAYDAETWTDKTNPDVISVLPGESFEIKVPKDKDAKSIADASQLTVPAGWTVEQTIKDGDSDVVFNIKVPENFGQSSHLIVMKDKFIAVVKVGTPLDISIKPVYNAKTSKVEINAVITNPSKIQTQSAEVSVKCLDNGQSKKIKIKALAPQKSQTLCMPESMKGLQQVEVRTEKGYYDEYQNIMPLISVPQAKKKPVIDGKLDDWKDAARFELNKPYQIKLIHDWKGTQDLSAKGYMKWDEKYLYLAVEVTDDTFQDSTYGGTWNGDSIILNIDPARAEGPASKGINVYNIALTKAGNIINSHWLSPNGIDFARKIDKIVIKRECTKIIYEMAVPWEPALDKGRVLKVGSQLGLGMAVDDNDGSTNRGWMEFGSGVNYTMNPNLYGDLFLVK